MANAFNQYMQAKSQAMQQGANMLAMQQVADKINREQSLRTALSAAYMPKTEGIDLQGPTQAGPALAPVPASPGGMDWQQAMQGAAEGGVVPEMMQMQAGMARAKGTLPSSIREWQEYQRMSPENQKRFLSMKRASQFQTIGGVPHQVGGGQPPKALSTLEKESAARGELAAGTKEGIATGEARTKLKDVESSLPRLKVVVEQLSKLGKTATYTKAGQMADATARQLGLKMSKGAISRREYIAKIDNEILPLLRQTFGAQFTEREGQSLKATLGDVNASPAEKDAVLRSFIDSKIAQIRVMKRKVGKAPTAPTAPTGNVNKQALKWATDNPNDPRAMQILQRLGAQ